MSIFRYIVYLQQTVIVKREMEESRRMVLCASKQTRLSKQVPVHRMNGVQARPIVKMQPHLQICAAKVTLNICGWKK